MGNLLRILLSTDPPSKEADIFVDFESKNILIINFVYIYIYIYIYMTHSQNPTWAKNLMFAHTKSKPTITLCIYYIYGDPNR